MIKIQFVGDISLGEYYLSFGHGPRTIIERQDILLGVRHILGSADFVVGNLEAPLSPDNERTMDPEASVLKGNIKHSEYLSHNNFRFLQVANNHSVQHGDVTFDGTVEALYKSGIRPLGLKDQGLAKIELNGVTLGFLAASDVPDNTDLNQGKYQKLNDDFLRKAQESVPEVDHLFILLHWGLESSTTPLPYQDKLANDLKALGVRGVIGTHPHLVYGVKNDDNFVYAPSLGDFVFDLAWDRRYLNSCILELTLDTERINRAKLWPLRLEKSGSTPLPVGDAIDIDSEFYSTFDNGPTMKGGQIRKVIYFLVNYFRGKTLLKTIFILKKVKNRLTSALSR
ncbi:hypothetical protein CF392_02535 [Tamilnaduibacter salinus]|uniref:Capsule synthesis protein CapA domain-containing protein n=1 Tax=Tamilnaduibacter salinus TaxID=1484056 RepID=A0A2A2I7L5_9GAMM|nr:CapA family protein [Tamilnaduibacter salinus]PAV27033.1 hypothetical protein CF392_02535 [Tamilnaduibacter salinus]